MPMDRPGEDALRAVAAVLAQDSARLVELIVVAGSEIVLPDDARIRLLVVPDRNPAVRRNRAAAEASGELLAFIDDDAFARGDWLENAATYLEANPGVLAVGGPDPAPDDSPVSELVSDTLLSTHWIGSGVAAHESRSGVFDVRSPHALALVNLIVRRDAFENAGGFDEAIGYIGEDTALIEKLIETGRVAYHDGVVVFHRRRSFPVAYVRQRWRYRLKTGRLLVRGGSRYRTPKILGFLVAGFVALATAIAFPGAIPWLLAAYAVLTIGAAAATTRLPLYWWPVIPIAFAVHHGTYFAGILAGVAMALVSGRDA
jgi:glycosyltransferase involved in cell wall biosynthesis